MSARVSELSLKSFTLLLAGTSPCPFFLFQRPHSNLKSKYQSLVAAEKLNFDPIQVEAVEQLQMLQDRLDGYSPTPASSQGDGLLSRVSPHKVVGVARVVDVVSLLLQWFGTKQKEKSVAELIKGIYMYGSVGRINSIPFLSLCFLWAG